MTVDGRKTPNGRTLFQGKVVTVLAGASTHGANAFEIHLRDLRRRHGVNIH